MPRWRDFHIAAFLVYRFVWYELPKILPAYKPWRRKADMHRPGTVVYSCLSHMSLWKKQESPTEGAWKLAARYKRWCKWWSLSLARQFCRKKTLGYGSSCASQNSFDVVMMSLSSKVQWPPSTPVWYAWKATKSRSARWSESCGSIEATYILEDFRLSGFGINEIV